MKPTGYESNKPVSLTGHLNNPDSLIGQCIKKELFPVTRAVLRQARENRPTGTFIEPPPKPYPFPTVGMALDYRIRYYLSQPSPAQLVAYDASFVIASICQSPSLLEEFWARFCEFLDAANPVRQRLSASLEQRFARYCFLLAKYEAFYRSGIIDDIFQARRYSNVNELLEVVPDNVVTDLTALSYAFYEHGLALFPPDVSIESNPEFAGSADVGGADGDFITGTCLVDIKTTIDPNLKSAYIHQLLGYVLLDYDNRYRIDRIAIYSARYCQLYQWSIDSLIRAMAHDETLSIDIARTRLRQAIAQEHERQRALQPSPSLAQQRTVIRSRRRAGVTNQQAVALAIFILVLLGWSLTLLMTGR